VDWELERIKLLLSTMYNLCSIWFLSWNIKNTDNENRENAYIYKNAL